MLYLFCILYGVKISKKKLDTRKRLYICRGLLVLSVHHSSHQWLATTLQQVLNKSNRWSLGLTLRRPVAQSLTNTEAYRHQHHRYHHSALLWCDGVVATLYVANIYGHTKTSRNGSLPSWCRCVATPWLIVVVRRCYISYIKTMISRMWWPNFTNYDLTFIFILTFSDMS